MPKTSQKHGLREILELLTSTGSYDRFAIFNLLPEPGQNRFTLRRWTHFLMALLLLPGT